MADYDRILVGYDGSENAKRALSRGVALSKGKGGALEVVVAVSTVLTVYGPTAPYYPPGFQDKIMQDGKEILEGAIQLAKAEGHEASGTVVDGHPAEAILQVAEKDGADLIVLGRRGISGVERFLMGGVSSSVVGHSKCDVLIVR